MVSFANSDLISSHASAEPLEPFPHGVERNAVLAVLVLLPARAQAEHEAAAGHVVDGRGHLREHGRVAIRVAGDQRADADARHGRGQGRERGPGLGPGHARLLAVRHEVVGVPDAVPAGGLDVAGDLEHVVERLLGVGPDAETHAAIMPQRFGYDGAAEEVAR